jgi:tetratricopeptide (TPR) repeat protein
MVLSTFISLGESRVVTPLSKVLRDLFTADVIMRSPVSAHAFRWITLPPLLLLICRTGLGTGVPSGRLKLEFEAARKAESRNSYRDAVKYYEEILQQDRSLPSVYNNLGLDYYRLKEYEKAEVTLRQGLRLKPDMLGARLFLGFAECNLGNFEESEKLLLPIVRHHPDNRSARLFLIRDQTGLGQFTLDLCQQTLKRFPGDVQSSYLIGTAALQQMTTMANYANQLGMKSPLFQWISLRTAIQKDDQVNAHRWRLLLQKEGIVNAPPSIREYDELSLTVQRCFQTVLERAPRSRFGCDVQGQIDEARGRVTQALAEYGRARDHFAAGRLLAQNLHLPQAAVELEQAVAAQPENKLAVALLAEVYVQEHQPAHAVPMLKKLLTQFPRDAYGWRDLGRAQFDLGQTKQAVHSFKTAVQLNPSLNGVHYELAMAYRKLGQTRLEKQEIEKFRTAGPAKQIHSIEASTN